MVAPPQKELKMTLLVRMTADHWTGQEMLTEGDRYHLPQDLALQVENAGHGKILNREVLEVAQEEVPEPGMMTHSDYEEYTVPELDEMLEERGLVKTGLKDDKIKRLMESDE